MAFFDNLTKKVSEAGSSAVQKGKELAEIAKQNSAINDEEKRITSTYEKIGKLYVETCGENPDEAFAELIASIADAKEKIAEAQKKIQVIKGITICPNCGGEIALGAQFCPACGAKVEIPVVEEVVEEAADVVRCSDCGAIIPEGNKFCTSCGKPVEAPAEAPAEE